MLMRKLFDADQHIVEPPDLWTSRMSKKYLDMAPRVVDNPEGGQAWAFDGGAWLRPMGLEGAAGQRPSDVSWKSDYRKMLPGCFEPKARLEAMDIDGVDQALQFPSVALSAATVADDDVLIQVFRSYNDGIKDWCDEGDSRRMLPVAIIPALGIEIAMGELDRIAKKGFKTYMFGSWPSGNDQLSQADDPFWALCEEAGVVISFHGRGFKRQYGAHGAVMGNTKKTVVRNRQPETNDNRATGLGVPTPVGQMIMSGVLDRFPKLKIGMVETGVGWIPFWMEQMDRSYTHQRWAGDAYPLKSMPSDYARRQTKGTIQLDGAGIRYRETIGVDNIMFSTDFPHATCDWPNSRQWMTYLMQGVPAEEQHKMLYANGAEFYGAQ